MDLQKARCSGFKEYLPGDQSHTASFPSRPAFHTSSVTCMRCRLGPSVHCTIQCIMHLSGRVREKELLVHRIMAPTTAPCHIPNPELCSKPLS